MRELLFVGPTVRATSSLSATFDHRPLTQAQPARCMLGPSAALQFSSQRAYDSLCSVLLISCVGWRRLSLILGARLGRGGCVLCNTR